MPASRWLYNRFFLIKCWHSWHWMAGSKQNTANTCFTIFYSWLLKFASLPEFTENKISVCSKQQTLCNLSTVECGYLILANLLRYTHTINNQAIFAQFQWWTNEPQHYWRFVFQRKKHGTSKTKTLLYPRNTWHLNSKLKPARCKYCKYVRPIAHL